MLIPAARYAFVFWFVISSNSGENLLVQHLNTHDKGMFCIAACTARCIQQRQKATQHQHQHQQQSRLKDCFDACQPSKFSSTGTNTGTDNGTSTPSPVDTLHTTHEHFNLKLVCRDDRSMSFRIDLLGASTASTESATGAHNRNNTAAAAGGGGAIGHRSENNTDRFNGRVYFVRLHQATDEENYLIYLVDENFFTIDGMNHSTVYRITAVAVHANNAYAFIAIDEPFATLQRGFTPNKVTNIQVLDFSLDAANERHLVAKITWKPSADMTCHYNIICFSPEDGAEYDISPLEIRNPRQLYTYELENLTFSTEYKVGIRAKNPNDIWRESELLWKSFLAPSCVEWFNYNFNICAPLKPQGVLVKHKLVGEHEYLLDITWQRPEYYPDYYTILVLDLDDHGESYQRNASKNATQLRMPHIILRGQMYQVHLTAHTVGGNSTTMIMNLTNVLVVVPEKNHIVKLIAVVLAPIFCIVILSLTTFIVCHRRAKLRRYKERCKYFEELEKKAPIDPKATFEFTTSARQLNGGTPDDLTQFQLDLEEKLFLNDAMEIERNAITLHEVLGEGAFGLVRRGTYNDEKLGRREVAVKMLKDQPSMDDMRAFRREIEVMKSVEKHPNIVGLIGHCTQRYNEMMLLTEYCSRGNLLDFLRDEWKYLHEMKLTGDSPAMAPHAPLFSGEQLVEVTANRLEGIRPNDGRSKPHHQQQQQQQHALNKIATTNGVFSLDGAFIETLKAKYRHFNATTRTASKITRLGAGNEIDAAAGGNAATATPVITVAADNKSYGYDEICTNACKCQVDVLLIKDVGAIDERNEAEQLEQMLAAQQQQAVPKQPRTGASKPTRIEVQNCECQQRRRLLAKKNIQNAMCPVSEAPPPPPALPTPPTTAIPPTQLSVENMSYFKYLPFEQVLVSQSAWHGHVVSPAAGSLKRQPVRAADLLDIARQVAVGMEFLAKNKVVHRDLAARNVLVAPDRTIKIADFGLSRDIYQENIYKKTGNGKLPIKWLALESMTHQVYTTQSDVWSYGILLYEIVTLGGTPYPSIPTNRLLYLLKTGYRMEKPRNCGQAFYNLMNSCWNLNPGERPNFSEIIKILDNLLSESPQQQIQNDIATLSAPGIAPPVLMTSASEDCYLKPLK